MKWNRLVLCCRQFAVSRKSRRPRIWGSASLFLRVWACHSSSSGDGRSMTDLTWMRGSKNISAEGGPERSFHGP